MTQKKAHKGLEAHEAKKSWLQPVQLETDAEIRNVVYVRPYFPLML